MSDHIEAELSDVADIIRGVTFPTDAKQKGAGPNTVACLRTTNVQQQVIWDDLIYVRDEYVRNDQQYVRIGDILVSMSNSIDLVGKCAIITDLPQHATFGAFIAVIRARPGIDPRYVFHVMRTPSFRARLREIASTTTNISNINSSKLMSSMLPFFGKSTRDLIVSKIDQLFSRIDEGERALERVQKLVERYRQSVLKAAVTGELTREWREKHKGQLESGEALLARILKARRKAWERSELEKMKAKGQKPANDNWKDKYNEPVSPDTRSLPALPAGWAWASLPMLSTNETCNGISVKGTDTPPGVAALRLDAMQDSGFDFSARRYIPISEGKAAHLRVVAGDFFVSRGNGSLHLVGKGVLATDPKELIVFPDTMIRYRLISDIHLSSWVSTIWASALIRRQIETLAKTTAGIYKISQEDIANIAVPLPPLFEQHSICSDSTQRLSRVEHLANDLESSAQQALTLRQSILRKAFSGALVAQDSTDEPASILLERITTEPGASEENTKSPRAKKAKDD